MKVRYAKENERKIAIRHWKDSFKDSEEQINFYFNNIFEHKNYLVLEKNKKIVSSLHENPYILNFNSNEIKTKYIVGVSTPVSEQRKGYMTELIKNMLLISRENNYPFVFLTPINPDIYRRYGFEYFSRIEKFKFNIEELSNFNISKKTEIIEINIENKDKYIKDLISVYNTSMEEVFCFLKRDHYYFNKLLLECFNDEMKVFISYENKKPKAYVIFSKYGEEIEVRESFAINFEAQKEILALLYSYKDYYKTISLYSIFDSNIEFLFKNQLKIEKKISPFMMMRILKPLEVLKFANIKLQNLKILIIDEIIEENTGVYYFDKKWKFTEKINEYSFKISIKDLSSLLTGFFTFDEMLYMKKIEIKEDKKIEIENIREQFKRKKSYLYEFQ